MKHAIFCLALVASPVVSHAEPYRYSVTEAAKAPKDQAEPIPLFQVDSTWPKVPSKWKLGDASSIGIDAQDRIWVLHRPRTLPADQASMAAPPVLVFDAAGNFIQAWGGSGNGYEWPQREHGIYIDPKGFVWIGGNNCPARNLPGLSHVTQSHVPLTRIRRVAYGARNVDSAVGKLIARFSEGVCLHDSLLVLFILSCCQSHRPGDRPGSHAEDPDR